MTFAQSREILHLEIRSLFREKQQRVHELTPCLKHIHP